MSEYRQVVAVDTGDLWNMVQFGRPLWFCQASVAQKLLELRNIQGAPEQQTPEAKFRVYVV